MEELIPEQWHYLVVNLLTIAYPLAQCCEKRVRFMSNWKAIVTALATSGAVYLAWDELFTRIGVWGFNERYLTGVYAGHLPLEECLFFVTTPFACLFVYEVLNRFIRTDLLGKYSMAIAWFFLCTSCMLMYFYSTRIYTATVCAVAAVLLSLALFVFKPRWLGRFFLAYFVLLIPFSVMNGWLTGGFTEEPIVWYSIVEITGVRLGSIPVEDFFYLLGYFLLTTWIYERSRQGGGAKIQSVP